MSLIKSLLHPMLRANGGLLRPLLPVPSASGEVIPQTLDGIANAADPLQAFSDACGLPFKVNFLWIGNELVGATELGGSGLDLVNTGVDQAQADARLGAGNTCIFNAITDKMVVADDPSLDVGSGAMAAFSVHAYDAVADTYYYLSKYASPLGWAMRINPAGSASAFVRTASGIWTATVTGPHSTLDAQVDLLRRDVTATTVYLDTREGSASAVETTVGNADNTAGLTVGPAPGGFPGFLGSWGLTAMVKGANAELVTATHRSNLQTWLGL